jgi:uncharacterized GH25 family protein
MNPKLLLAVAAAALFGIVGWLLLAPPAEDASSNAAERQSAAGTAAALTAEDLERGARTGESVLAPTGKSATAARSAVRETTSSAKSGDLSEAALALIEGPTFRGRVLSDLGLPVVGADVRFERSIDRNLVNLLAGARGGPTVTDENGRFELQGSPGEKVTLVVGADGFTEINDEDFVLPEDPDVPLEDIFLLPSLWLWGQVTDDRGQPLPGATLARVDPGRNPWEMRWNNADPDAIADENGEFQLPREPVGPWTFKVRAEGYLTGTFEGEGRQAGRSAVPLEFQLLPGKTVSGKLAKLPEDKRETTVVRALPQGEGVFREMTSDLAGTSDVAPDGAWSISGLDPEREYKVVASATDIGPGAMFSGGGERSAPEFLFPSDQEIELEYRAGTELLFQVLDARTKEPVENFRTRFGQPFASKDLLDGQGEPRQYFKDGQARFADLHEEDKMPWGNSQPSLEIQASGYLRYINDEIELAAGDTIDLGTILLEPVPMLRFKVVDRRDGDPVKNARVQITPMDNGLMPFLRGNESLLGNRGFAAKTDDDGHAEVTSLGTTPSKLEISKGGYAPYYQSDFVADASGQELEIALSKGGDVVVLVRDAGGNPVPDVDVIHRRPSEPEGRETEQSNDQGRVRYRRLEPGTHRFRLARSWQATEPPDGEEGWVDVAVFDEGELEVVLAAKSLGRVSGRVFLGGRPLAGAEIDFTSVEEDGEQNWNFGRGQKGSTEDETDAEGKYSVPNLRYGDYVATVTHPSLSMGHPVELEIARPEVAFDVQIPITGIRGRVLDHRGRPVPGVSLRISSTDESEEERVANRFRRRFFNQGRNDDTRTRDDGTFEFQGVPADTSLRVRVDSELWFGPSSEVVKVDAGEVHEGLELEVIEAASVDIAVELPGDQRWGWAQIRAIPEEVEVPEGYPKPDERQDGSWGGQNAKLEGLPPGRWKIVATFTPPNFGNEADGQEPEAIEREQLIDLRAGERSEIEISFK